MAKLKFGRVQKLIDRAVKRAKTSRGRDQVESVSIYTNGYAEPGYADPDSGVICLGNWNGISQYNPQTNDHDTLDDAPCWLGEQLESIGVSLEWSDEWEVCSACGKLVRSQPSSYSWTQQYWTADDGIECVECTQKDPTAYFEHLEGNANSCITIDDIEPTEHGYQLLTDNLENGLYGGQDADPKKIAAALQKQGVKRFIFKLDSVGQFDIQFSVYVHESEWDQLNQQQFDKEDKSGPDPAKQMQAYLHDASLQMAALQQNCGVIVSKPDPDDPTRAKVRMVSRQDFIDGKALEG